MQETEALSFLLQPIVSLAHPHPSRCALTVAHWQLGYVVCAPVQQNDQTSGYIQIHKASVDWRLGIRWRLSGKDPC